MHQSNTLSKPLAAKMANKAEGEEDEEESLLDFVSDHANQFFIDHIPVDSIKDLDPTYMYYFGSVAHLLAIFLFVVFTYRNYYSEVEQAFIAVSESDGSDCSTVSIAVSGEYLVDYSGYWIGSPQFVNSQAIYALSFSNFEISSITQYQDMLALFQESFTAIGRVSLHQNLAENLLFWMCFQQYYSVADPTAVDFSKIGYGQLQSIELTGDPQNVFDLEYIKVSVSSIEGNCPLPAYTQFDQANGFLSGVYFNYTQFASSPLCAAAVEPKSFGYVPQLDDGAYTLKLDVRSFAAALAVNYGILPFANLKIVNFAVKGFSFDGVEYSIGQYYDVRTPLMDTITCILNTTAVPPDKNLHERLCFLVVGETFALPVFNHYGASKQRPEYCDCASEVGRSKDCQEFNLLSGLLFYRSKFTDIILYDLTQDLASFGLYNLLTLMRGFPAYREFNRAAYNASYIAAGGAYAPTPSQLSTAYDFCRINTTQTCSVMVFNSFEATSYEVSNYKYQLFNGSCRNASSVPQSSWDNMMAQPPVQFTQTYFECYDSAESSFINAIGIASGNVQIFIPFVVFALLPFLYFILVLLRQVPPKPEYTREEQDQALEIFSMLLLRLRDGKTRGIKPRGVLAGLTKELISAAKEEGGYPDSDDDEEDEDSEADGRGARRRSSGKPIKRLRNSSLNSTASSLMEPAMSEYTAGGGEEGSGKAGGGGVYNRKSTQQGSGGAQHLQRKSTATGGKSVHTVGSDGRPVTAHRTKMGVFTKHIQERHRQQQRLLSTESNGRLLSGDTSGGQSAGGVSRQASYTAFFNPFGRTASQTAAGRTASQDNPMHNPYAANKQIRTTVNNLNRAPPSSHPASPNSERQQQQTQSDGDVAADSQAPSGTAGSAPRKRTSLIGYLFGGGGEEEGAAPPLRESEMTAARAPVYIDLNVEIAPQGVRILNEPDEFFGGGGVVGGGRSKQAAKKPIGGQEVDLLVDDLLRLFGEAVAVRGVAGAGTEPQKVSTASTESPECPAGATGDAATSTTTEGLSRTRTDSLLSVGNGAAATSTRDSFSFVQAKQLSARLAAVRFEELLARDDRAAVFLKLSNALCMHAAVELGCEMRAVNQLHGDKIAYNIGGKMLTANDLDSIL